VIDGLDSIIRKRMHVLGFFVVFGYRMIARSGPQKSGLGHRVYLAAGWKYSNVQL